MNDIHKIFIEIEEKSENGNYIYRGEPNCNESDENGGVVSSRLWREYTKHAGHCDVEIVQEALLDDAKKHMITAADSDDLSTEIQHYGGNTNLIDFSTSYFIALFFACDGHYNCNGRVILQDMSRLQKLKKGGYPS